jgi:hypothetical protein
MDFVKRVPLRRSTTGNALENTKSTRGFMRQPSPQALILLIDGNNLAHFLYTNLVPGQKMTPADTQRLIKHLGSYARQYGSKVEVECCLDRSAGSDARVPENLRILAVRFPKTADELLLDRFWFHHYTRRPCLVITNDEAILDEVEAAGGAKMLVSTFVRRAGTHNPVFRDPDDLPPIVPPPISEENDPQPAPEEPETRPDENQPVPLAGQRHIPLPPAEADNPSSLRKLDSGKAQEASETYQEPEPYYALDLPSWPVVEGTRFLLSSFCPSHRADIVDLFRSLEPGDLTPADLLELAQLLRTTCAAEPNFISRGGSLMDKVRLALLQSESGEMSLSELASKTGIKTSGLRGRIKAKAARWLHVLS